MIVAKKTSITVNGRDLLKEVHKDQNSDIILMVGSIIIEPKNIGIPSNIANTVLTFFDYLQVVSQCEICAGCEVTDDQAVTGTTVWNIQGSVTNRKHSNSCRGMLNIISRTAKCKRCYSLGYTMSGSNAKDEMCDEPHTQEPDEQNHENSDLLGLMKMMT